MSHNKINKSQEDKNFKSELVFKKEARETVKLQISFYTFPN